MFPALLFADGHCCLAPNQLGISTWRSLHHAALKEGSLVAWGSSTTASLGDWTGRCPCKLNAARR